MDNRFPHFSCSIFLRWNHDRSNSLFTSFWRFLLSPLCPPSPSSDAHVSQTRMIAYSWGWRMDSYVISSNIFINYGAQFDHQWGTTVGYVDNMWDKCLTNCMFAKPLTAHLSEMFQAVNHMFVFYSLSLVQFLINPSVPLPMYTDSRKFGPFFFKTPMKIQVLTIAFCVLVLR